MNRIKVKLACAMFWFVLMGISPAMADPVITWVGWSHSTDGYTLTIHGSGFGQLARSLPYRGCLANFRIADAAQLGCGEWGYSGDAKSLMYQSWSNTVIRVSSFPGSLGDAVTIAIWNPQNGVGTTWGGNVTSKKADNPYISSVEFHNKGRDLKIVIRGSGFGPTPIHTPFAGDLDFFAFGDFRTHHGGSSLFGAGDKGFRHITANPVTIKLLSWSDDTIRISGFAGTYGQNGAKVKPGDPVVIIVWNSRDKAVTGPQTAWGGSIPKPER